VDEPEPGVFEEVTALLDAGDVHDALDVLQADEPAPQQLATVETMDLALAVAREVLSVGQTRSTLDSAPDVMRSSAVRAILYRAATVDAPAAGMTLSPEVEC
jgi:hypothetical protein